MNNLIVNRTSKDIATFLVNLTCSIKDKNCHVNILIIILRIKNKILNQKGYEVNTGLKNFVMKRTFT